MRRLGWLTATTLGAAVLLATCAGRTRSAPPTVRPTPATWSDTDLTISWLGHASVLINFAGTTILTDPTFFPRIGVSVGPVTIGPKRLVEPALHPQELPPLDAVLVSHPHMDSLDRPSLARVASTPLLVVPADSRDLVDDLGFARVDELGWRQQILVNDVTIEAVEVEHWGKRWPWDGWRGYNAYLLSRGDHAVLFAPDTAYTPAFGMLGRRVAISVALLGNGAYDPWVRNHADPEQVWRMFRESGASYLIPIHWDTFRLGREPLGDAITRLLAAAENDGASDRIVVRRIGETWRAPAAATTARQRAVGEVRVLP